MAQQQIDFGSFPNDPTADAIRSAFQKIQENFTELYTTQFSSGVSSVTVGPGLSQFNTTGNVQIEANIPNITIQTSSSLLVGVGVATTNTATISSYVTPFRLDLAPTITTGNANFSGNVRTSNLQVTGSLTSNLTPSVGTLTLGNATNRFNQIHGNTIFVGTQTLTSNTTTVTIANLSVSGNITSSNISATAAIITNASITSNLTTSNLSVAGTISSNFVPSATNTYSLGSSSLYWKDLYLSGNTLTLGSQVIESTEEAVVMENLTVTSNLSGTTLSVVTIEGSLLTNSQPNITTIGTLTGLSVSGNTSTGELTVSGNVQATSIIVDTVVSTTITGNVVIPPGANLAAPGGDTQIMFNDSGNAAAVPGMTFNKNTNLLSITGNVQGGNIVSSGALSVTGNASVGNLGTQSITATGNVSATNLVTTGILATTYGVDSGANLAITSMSGTGSDGFPANRVTVTFNSQSVIPFPAGSKVFISNATPSGYNGEYEVLTGNTTQVTFTSPQSATVTSLGRIQGGGNIVTNGFLQVVGNASVGNITTTTLSGAVVVVSGNISGANLVASGILRVDGNANVGNLTTSGIVSAATLRANTSMSAASISSDGFSNAANFFTNGSFIGNLVGNVNATGTVSAGSLTASSVSASSLVTSGFANAGNFFTNGSFIGNLQGNVTTSGTVSAGTVSASSISASSLTSSGNASAVNFNGTGLNITANATFGNITNINDIFINGQITGAAVMQSGLINATQSLTAGNLVSNSTLFVASTATAGNIVSNNNIVIQKTASVASNVIVGSSLAITTISGNGTVVTVTYPIQDTPPFPVGGTVVISNISGVTAYNGTYTVLSGNLTTVTYSSTTTGLGVISGSSKISTGGLGLQVTGNTSLSNLEIVGLLNASLATANVNGLNSNVLSVVGTANAGNFTTTGTLSVNGNATLGNVQSSFIRVTGVANAASFETTGTLNATGSATVGSVTSNGAIVGSTSLTVGSTANITSGLNVGYDLALTGLSGNGTAVTGTFATQTVIPFPVGSSIVISGVTPSGYNGTYTVTAATTSTVRFTSALSSTVTILGRVRSNTTVEMKGTANIVNLNATTMYSDVANLFTVNVPTGGLLSMATANANIGNIAAGILATEGNITSANGNMIISNGYLSVSGNVSANRVTVATGVVNNSYSVGGSVSIGANVQITTVGTSGNGTAVTAAFQTPQSDTPFPVNQSIVVTGLTPSAYNGTFVVVSCNTTHVVYNSTATGTVTTGGFARSTGTGLVLQSAANVGGLTIINGGSINAGTGNILGGNVNVGSGNVTGGTFTATLFSGNGASITGINMLNTGMSVVITSVAGTGSVQTLGFSTQSFPPFSVGQTITVSGVTPTGYNGTYTVTGCTTTAVTMAGSATGNTGFVSGVGRITGGSKSQYATITDTVISSSQPNITSVGTLTALNVSGAFQGENITSNGYFLSSVSGLISAAGTTLGTATVLTKQLNLVGTSTPNVNDGIRLPAAAAGMQIIIINLSGQIVKVYPASGGSIDETNIATPVRTNQPITMGVNSRLMLVASNTTLWWSMFGVYG